MNFTLPDLFARRIEDLLASEAAIARALPKWIARTRNEDLRAALERHLKETDAQSARLRSIAKPRAGSSDAAARCPATDALLAEGEERLRDSTPSDEADAAIVDACRRVEHHEIASYAGAIGLAAALMDTSAFEALKTTLREEEFADETLAKVSEKNVERLREAFTRKAPDVDVSGREPIARA